jgi:hypothetical protein
MKCLGDCGLSKIFHYLLVSNQVFFVLVFLLIFIFIWSKYYLFISSAPVSSMAQLALSECKIYISKQMSTKRHRTRQQNKQISEIPVSIRSRFHLCQFID